MTTNISRNNYIKKYEKLSVSNRPVISTFTNSLGLVNVQSNDILIYSNSSWNNVTGSMDIISDLTINNLSNGHILQYNNPNWSNKQLDLSNITDLDLSVSLQNKDYIQYNGVNWVNSPLELNNLSDTNLSNISTNNTLIYNSGVYSNSSFIINEDSNTFSFSNTNRDLIFGQINGTYIPSYNNNLRISPVLGLTSCNNSRNVAIGHRALNSTTGTDYSVIAIGSNSASNVNMRSQGKANAIAIGTTSAYNIQYYQIGIGYKASLGSCILGTNIPVITSGDCIGTSIKGHFNQGTSLSLMIGTEVNGEGTTAGANRTVMIGYRAKYRASVTTATASVAIGTYSLCNYSEGRSIGIGYYAGANSQNTDSIAIGSNAGFYSQQTGTVAIGSCAGSNSQFVNSICIGTEAGRESQGSNSIAIGYNAGSNLQGCNSIAIGQKAGYSLQGSNSIAIGYDCGSTANNSIVFNASNGPLNLTSTGLFLTPNILTGEAVGYGVGRLFYDSVTGELKYSTT